MMNKMTLLALLALCLAAASCGGGGAGGADEPSGESPGVASKLQLLPAQFSTQTPGGTIVLNAKVLDDNGNPVSGTPVAFTNLSAIGQLSTNAARTNGSGIAVAHLTSADSGFVTVEVSMNSGQDLVRDRKTMFFSSGSQPLPPTPPTPPTPPSPTLILSVDDGNGTVNEQDDFNVLKNANDQDRTIIATVLDTDREPVLGATVTFQSDTTEGTFPLGATRVTDTAGQASVLMRVVPSTLRPLSTTLNIGGFATVDGQQAANLVTLFLQPVAVAAVQVSANPQSVDSAGTAAITAVATTTAGTTVPDNTTINFSTNQGGVEPFSQTPSGGALGAASAEFTAPTLLQGSGNITATITASVGGKSASVNVTVIAPPAPPVQPPALAINPPTAAAIGTSGAVITFSIVGGTPSYTTSSSNLLRAFNDVNGNGVLDAGEGGIWNSSPVTVTVPLGAPLGTVDLNVSDAVGGTAKATITVQ